MALLRPALNSGSRRGSVGAKSVASLELLAGYQRWSNRAPSSGLPIRDIRRPGSRVIQNAQIIPSHSDVVRSLVDATYALI